MTKIKSLPKKDILHELFDYKNGYLYWKKSKAKAKQGNIAGWLEKNGYMACGIDNVRYRVHRLIFAYHHGWCPEFIDHINGIKTDNRIENLRPATAAQNNANKKMSKNKTGFKGVFAERGKFKSLIKVNNKTKHLGYFDTAEKASIAYLQMATNIYGEYAWTNKSANT